MDIGKLRHRLTIEENTGTTNDGAGNKLPRWEPVATTWAEVKPLRGQEVDIANQFGQEITHRIKMRYRTDITKEKHRIVFKGRTFHIEYLINVNEMDRELNVYCREG